MFFVGVDLGQRRDFTAVAAVERCEMALAWMEPDYRGLEVRFLERIALGTPYPRVVQRVEEIALRLKYNCAVIVDGTGVGAPVVDLLRQSDMPCEVIAVVITGGERENRARGGVRHVPKQDLIGVLQVLLEQRELRIAKELKETPTLVRELVDMRVTVTGRGRVRMGAEGSGEHDDLVMATALACWGAKRPTIGYGRERLL